MFSVLRPADGRRLIPVALRLFVYYFLWFVFFGVPLLYFGPRTCVAGNRIV